MAGDERVTGRAPGPYHGPVDLDLRRAWRAERRALAREHHPDRGGDAEVMQDRLAALDVTYRRLDATAAGVDSASTAWPRPRRALRRVRIRTRRLTRAARARIPSQWPGHRRYIELSDRTPPGSGTPNPPSSPPSSRSTP